LITDNNIIADSENFNLANRLKILSQTLLTESKKIFNQTLENFDQSSFNIFLLLIQKESLSIKQISSYLKITHPAAVQLVNKLIQKKFVEKYDSPEDKRVTIVRLTTKGKKAYESLKSVADKIDTSYKEIINEVDPKFFITLSLIEERIKSKSIFERVSEKVKNEQIKSIKIVKYHDEYRHKFKEMNLDWLNKYFEVEDEDLKALENPDTYYIKSGGEIFFALINDEICGTCAIKKISNGIYELSKMAVPEIYQGKQIGKKLALTAIGFAYEKGAEKIILETSPKLTAAINLYKNLGFEIVHEQIKSNYRRALFRMQLKLK
jgi:DNA-binding MarR family transcriptional regulator/N-acetylglutamate synthase-like GNAT family acetyltransferase